MNENRLMNVSHKLHAQNKDFSVQYQKVALRNEGFLCVVITCKDKLSQKFKNIHCVLKRWLKLEADRLKSN